MPAVAAKTNIEDIFRLGIYNLCDNWMDNFTEEHENNVESLFEINFKDGLINGNDTVTLEVRRSPNVSATVDVTQEQVNILSKVPSLVNPGTTYEDVQPILKELTEILTKGINGSQGAPATVGVDVKLGAGEDVGSIKLIDASDVIMSLFDRQRQALLLCKRDGLSYHDAAQQMGISEKTVEHLLSNAMKSLRRRKADIYYLPFLALA